MIKKICVLLLVLNVSLFSDIAKLDQVKGDVLVRSKNFTKKEGAQGTPLLFGDTVKTNKGASTHIKFSDGSVILVKENSTFKIKGKKKTFIIDFDKGEFLIGIKRKSKETTYTIKTPSAVVGVRGTLFWGLSDDNLTSTYACFTSSIEVSANGVKKILSPGEKVVIPFGKEPGAILPAKVPLSYMDTFAINGGIQSVKEMLKTDKPSRKNRRRHRED